MGDDRRLQPRNLFPHFEAVARVCAALAGSRSRSGPAARAGRGDRSSSTPRGCGKLWERLEHESPRSGTPPARPCQAVAPFETGAKVTAPQGGRKRSRSDGPGSPAAKDSAKRRPAAMHGAEAAAKAAAAAASSAPAPARAPARGATRTPAAPVRGSSCAPAAPARAAARAPVAAARSAAAAPSDAASAVARAGPAAKRAAPQAGGAKASAKRLRRPAAASR
ncbi:unnamed protein product [Prorocentrum cordatum]|uniref:Uncharacterized protein n=1 Tax=Prorocentrum cordatum TaxID=2364126 RepID=A0ABN9Y265_9DINO|nr:unnamed protein product [Polarella glacialis]